MAFFEDPLGRYYSAPGELMHPDPYGGESDGFRFVVYFVYADWHWFDDCRMFGTRRGAEVLAGDQDNAVAIVQEALAGMEDPDNWWAVMYDEDTGQMWNSAVQFWIPCPITFSCYNLDTLTGRGRGPKKFQP